MLLMKEQAIAISKHLSNGMVVSDYSTVIINVSNIVTGPPCSDRSMKNSRVCISFPEPTDSGLLPSLRFLLPVEIHQLTPIIHFSLDHHQAQWISKQSILDGNQGILTGINPIIGIPKNPLGLGNESISNCSKLLYKMVGGVPMYLESPL